MKNRSIPFVLAFIVPTALIFITVIGFIPRFSSIVLAQSGDCTSVRDEALSTAATSCDNAGPNEICLGHSEVTSVINCDTDIHFDSPGDIIPLQTLCAMRLTALQPTGEWGIAVMKVNPQTDAAGMTYVLFGDVEIQNAASASSQLRAWVKRDADIHSDPGLPYSSLRAIKSGEIIHVNACNCTQHWLRTVLEDGRVGWVFAGDVSILGDVDALPVVKADTPVYAPMQAFNFVSGREESTCAASALAGILIQSSPDSSSSDFMEERLQINGVEIVLSSTIFVESRPNDNLSIAVLDGIAHVTVDTFTVDVPAGTRAVLPLSAENVSDGSIQVAPYTEEDIVDLPTALLPVTIDPSAALRNEMPQVIGVEPCAVLSGSGPTTCRVHFINPDGDALTRIEATFVQAPQGEWTGSVMEAPEIIDGDNKSGTLAWETTCTLGSANFIGPVEWAITITDEAGHASQTFPASFNCVDG